VKDGRPCAALILATVLFAGPALGEPVGKWKTPTGTLYFGNRPPAGSTLLGVEGPDESPSAVGAVDSESATSTSSTSASERVGKVVGIADGDTFTLLVGREQLKIRLAEIDTPEEGQAYGNRARQALSSLIYGKTVRVTGLGIDRYQRTVGRVYVGDLDVNAEMVRRGAAWVYRKYATDRFLYDLEEDARSARRGVWASPEAEREPPWQWRVEQGDSHSPRRPSATAHHGPVIGNLRSLIYHRPDCPDYGKVSPRSRVYFDSRAAAEAAGFREARNCP
jgi:endonuclease YncB( thermonuclease family)